jgi:hypothetical protein
MAWSDVANRIKFFGIAADTLGNPTGLDGEPITVKDLMPEAVSFATFTEDGASIPKDKVDILSALQDLYDHSASARLLLDAGTAGEDVWLMAADIDDANPDAVPATLRSV